MICADHWPSAAVFGSARVKVAVPKALEVSVGLATVRPVGSMTTRVNARLASGAEGPPSRLRR